MWGGGGVRAPPECPGHRLPDPDGHNGCSVSCLQLKGLTEGLAECCIVYCVGLAIQATTDHYTHYIKVKQLHNELRLTNQL
jgi:hypothetical protein